MSYNAQQVVFHSSGGVIMRARLYTAVISVVLQSAVLVAQEQTPAEFVGTPEERELVSLLSSLQKKYDAYHAEAEKIKDERKRTEFFEQQDPSQEVVPKLLSLEARHPTTLAGLMALRRVVLLGGGGEAPENPRNRARRAALKRLPFYAHDPLLVEILRYVDTGNFEPETRELLLSLARNEQAHAVVREFSELMIARCIISVRDWREYLVSRSDKLTGGDMPRFADEQRYLKQQLDLLPPAATIKSWENEAITILRKLSASESALRQPAVKNIDPAWYLVRVDEDRTKTMPTISELAKGELFKEQHLRKGKPAPDLELKLLAGEEWSLSSQRKRAVIIQFSFKGCGPCEEMYPTLREIQQKHGPRVAILSIMADEKREDTEAAVAEGTLTWNIYWDGFRGPVATRWAVQGFPTVYVIDTQGDIAAVDQRGDDLKNTIAELLK
jgi:thiol-disulfide isomerase/thioredoxin